MKRTNTFAVRPLSDTGEQVLRDLLDASAALWNEVNYERLMRYNDEDGFEVETEGDDPSLELEMGWSQPAIEVDSPTEEPDWMTSKPSSP